MACQREGNLAERVNHDRSVELGLLQNRNGEGVARLQCLRLGTGN
jgi:hypothetical protein